MKTKLINGLWGLLLILAGGFFLAWNYKLIPELSPQLWAIVLAVLSLLFFTSYLISGVRHWGWLFPALILAATSATILLADTGRAGAFIATLFTWCVALPFVVAFALSPRESWWALIPAWVLAAVGLIVLLADRVQGEWIGILVQLAIALPFLVVFLANRKAWWALIPAFVLLASAAITLLATQISGDVVGGIAPILIGLPFFVVYFWSPKNWWALIPAGVMASIGLAILLFGGGETEQQGALLTGLMFLGWGATFAGLWLRRASQPTDWAKYPAIGLGATALVAFAAGAGANFLWPVALILGGLLLFYNSWRTRSQ